MDYPSSSNSRILKPPSWKGVRSIYKKLSDEFHILTGAYKIKIGNETKLNLDHLIVVIDEVDHCIDNIPQRKDRDSITQRMIEFLRNDELSWSHPYASKELVSKMENIKQVVHREKIIEEFVAAAEAIFLNTELKRHSVDINEVIDFIRKEGAATARLPLSILKIDPKHPFSLFFTKLCTMMGIADLVFDAKQDYKNKIISFKPSLGLYYKLNKIMIVDGFRLLWSFPNSFLFLWYCVKFTWALYRED